MVAALSMVVALLMVVASFGLGVGKGVMKRRIHSGKGPE